jgi:hypothetical protein
MTTVDERPAASLDDLIGMTAASRVLGELIPCLPSGVRVCEWRVTVDSVKGQLAHSASDRRLEVRDLADLFELVYAETAADNGDIRLAAKGDMDEVAVEFWTYVTAVSS